MIVDDLGDREVLTNISKTLYSELVRSALQCYPEESCGLLLGSILEHQYYIERFIHIKNKAKSALRYELDPNGYFHAEELADSLGLSIIGVFHSHTRSSAFPSPTDIENKVSSDWLYLILSLRHPYPELRGYLIGASVIESTLVC